MQTSGRHGVEVTLPADWRTRLDGWPAGELRGAPLRQWRDSARRELGLPDDRPVIATGHQTLLWHPGILAKYMLAGALTGDRTELGAANLIVDQHTDRFGDFEIPVRRSGCSLGLKAITLIRTRHAVPMGRHAPFDPPPAGVAADAALPCVAEGVQSILQAVAAHRDRPNAALQMAAALDDLMSPWVEALPGVCGSRLMETSLARALLEEMAADPRRCASCYNAAVEQVAEAGIPRLEVTADRVELPLWKLDPADRRERADDLDLRRHLDGGDPAILLPRALLLTLLVRTSLCDLFDHGTGGARYDTAMERWLRSWLGLRPCAIAVATATLRLPLGDGEAPPASALQAAHRAWHDPDAAASRGAPSEAKRKILAVIAAAPRRSADRARLFRQLHDRLAELRTRKADVLAGAGRRTEEARRAFAEAAIRDRRTWPFPLYPRPMLDDLAAAIRELATGGDTGGRGQRPRNAGGSGG